MFVWSTECLRKWRTTLLPTLMPPLDPYRRVSPSTRPVGSMRPPWSRVQADLRRRILRAFVGRGLLESCDAKDMLAYQHDGFSADAGVCIEAHDRAALERPLRYCARPPFARDRLRKEGVELVYRCAKQCSEPTSDNFGVLAPNSPLRAPLGNAVPTQPSPPKRSPAHYLWAALIARIYEVFPLLCPMCGGQMRLIAFITEGT